MGAGDTEFRADIAAIYERLLVPLLFESYAADLARRIATLKPRSVLETAAGTGAVTRALATALGSNAQLTATDLNEPMLGIARERMADARVQWQQADALALPFDDGSFDAVVCQFGVMFFPDKLRGFQEARQPGGLRARCRGGLLPGHAHSERDRTTRCVAARRGDAGGGTGTGHAIRPWRHRRAHQRTGFQLRAGAPAQGLTSVIALNLPGAWQHRVMWHAAQTPVCLTNAAADTPQCRARLRAHATS
jgi:SAM-dependent methyltransferase